MKRLLTSGLPFQIPMIFDDDTPGIMQKRASVSFAFDLTIRLHLSNEQDDRVPFCIGLNAKIIALKFHPDHRRRLVFLAELQQNRFTKFHRTYVAQFSHKTIPVSTASSDLRGIVLFGIVPKLPL